MAHYRIALKGALGSTFVVFAPLIGDVVAGGSFDLDAAGPHLVKLLMDRAEYFGEMDVGEEEEPRPHLVASVRWGNADYDTELDLFAAPVRVGRRVTAKGMRSEHDAEQFEVVSIQRL